MKTVTAVKIDEVFNVISLMIGDREIIDITLEIKNGIRETTPTPLECIANDLEVPTARSFGYDGESTIKLMLKVAKKYDESVPTKEVPGERILC